MKEPVPTEIDQSGTEGKLPAPKHSAMAEANKALDEDKDWEIRANSRPTRIGWWWMWQSEEPEGQGTWWPARVVGFPDQPKHWHVHVCDLLIPLSLLHKRFPSSEWYPAELPTRSDVS